jgi:hypothetical protein
VIGQCAASLYAINSHVDASLVGLVVGWLVLLVGWSCWLVLLVGLVGWLVLLVGLVGWLVGLVGWLVGLVGWQQLYDNQSHCHEQVNS